MKYLYSLLLLLSGFIVNAQSNILWDFTTASPTSGLPVTNLTVSDVSQGNNNGTTTMITTTSASSGYTGASGSGNAGLAASIGTLSTAAGGSAYFEFTFTPLAGSVVSLTNIDFGTRSTGTGPQMYSIKTSVNAFGADVVTATIANNSTWSLKSHPLTVTGAAGAPVIVRIYGYGGAGSPSTGTANWRIDDLKITLTVTGGGPDVTPPTVTTLIPADDAIGVAVATPLSITFSEPIVKGTGNIVIKKSADNSVFQTIDVTTAAVAATGSNASITINALTALTGYYVEIAAGAFKDLANNNFAGISGNSTWNFTTAAATGATTLNADFQTCTGAISNGFTQFSATGPQVWACTTFGRDPANPAGTTAFPSAVQINGFANGSNVINEDWLISPSLNLTSTSFPLLSFWSRTAFNGAPLKLRVSTNYTGIGNPNAANWVDLNGQFPQQTSNIWTLSQNINLTAYKTANTYIAFVYNATDDDGARWTLDDISITNSPTPPPASLTPNTGEVNFGFVASGTSAVKTFTLTGNDITGAVTLNATGNFLISKTNSSFAASISFTQAEANNIQKTVYVQFSPTAPSLNYAGTVKITTPTVADTTIILKGNSIDAATTLEVVNLNIEWFGSTTLGPSNDNQQEQNVKTVLQNIGADIYALQEVVSEPRLANIVSQMPGYSYVLSNYGSYTNPNQAGAGPLSEAQKLGMIYKTALFPGGVTTQALLSAGINTAADISNPAYNWFASGRFPYMVTGTTTLNGVTKTIRFIILHAKANTSPTLTSYNRRKAGNDSLRIFLNANYPNDNIMMLGDFNDDLDSTITAGITPKLSSYKSFTDDAANFFSPTLALSLAGKKSTVSYNDMIDHVMISNEMQCSYLPGSANVLTDVTSLVTNYGTTTTDHYPVFTRYLFVPFNNATISYTGSPYCNTSTTANATLTGNSGGIYSSTTGLVINSATGTVDIAASTPGTYVVTYTLAAAGACNPLFTTTTNISINAPATAPTGATASSNTICGTSGTVTLTAIGGTTSAAGLYKWYSGTCGGTLIGTGAILTNVPVTANTTFYVRIESSCNVTSCQSVTVTLTSQVTVSLAITPAGGITPFTPATITASVMPAGNYSYQWTKNNITDLSVNADKITVRASDAGNYKVKVTSAGGCVVTTPNIFVASAASSMLFISPNPNNGIFNVSFNNGNANLNGRTVNVFDSKGAKVFSKSFTNNVPFGNMTVDLRKYAAGIYFVTLNDSTGERIASGSVQVL
jgi:endonuclease/exonuclease/phosphatase family metal-dependent hydrolase